jgi:DNA-binding NarL/FixJ family response regulator
MWLRRKVHPAEVLSGAPPDPAAEPNPVRRLAREPARGYLTPVPRLVLAFDQDLSSQLRRAAHGRQQPLGELAAELLAFGLEQQAQRADTERALQVLTERQRQVVWMTAQGQTNRQIAQALVISPETVKTHMRHALAQLGLRSKAELRMLLLDLGMRWWEKS